MKNAIWIDDKYEEEYAYTFKQQLRKKICNKFIEFPWPGDIEKTFSVFESSCHQQPTYHIRWMLQIVLFNC